MPATPDDGLLGITHLFPHNELMVNGYGIVVREFVLQWYYYVHFRANTIGKGMIPIILPAMGKIVPLLFF